MAESYIRKDTVGIYEELLDLFEASNSSWHPRTSNEADPGVVLIKAIAMLEDKHNYRSDMALAQAYPDSVSDRQSAYELLKTLGYLMKQARAAKGTVEIMITSSGWADTEVSYTIPKFSEITDATKSLKFFTTEEVTITRNEKDDIVTPVTVQAGEPLKVIKEGYEYFTLKDVDEQGRLYLGKTGLAQNGVFVFTTDNAESETAVLTPWMYLDFVLLKPQSRWYTIQTADTGEVYVQFPDNFNELIGASHILVYATYTTGANTNIAAGLLSQFVDEELQARFAVTQPKEFTSGQDEESINLAVQHYYETHDTCKTLVTPNDFKSAIKYLVCALEDDTASNVKRGNRYFSNVIVDTANSRKTKIRVTCNGTDYTLFRQDTSKSSNQVDVIAMKASDNTSYAAGFKQYDGADDAQLALIKSDIEEQLQNSTAADVDIKFNTTDRRILAVTTPTMRIRVANYTDAIAAQIKEKIKNYFYSTYKAENLVPGKGLDYQTVVDDIKALSTNILSVNLDEFEYTPYTYYEDVDGKSVRADINSDNTPTALTIDATARAILAGDVPMFKFFNRQNTRSKQLAAYAVLADSNGLEGASTESTLFIPWKSTNYELVNEGKPIAPVVTSVTYSGGYTNVTKNEPGSKQYTAFALGRNHILQIRKKLHRTSETFGYGLQYLLKRTCAISTDLVISSATTIKAGTILEKDSTLTVANKYTIGEQTYKAGENFTPTSKVQLQNDIAVTTGTIKAGSFLADGTVINNITYSDDLIPQGVEYELKEGESLTIIDSKGNTVATLGKKDWILVTGGDLIPATGTASKYNVLSTTQNIAKLTDEVSEVGTDFKYFLSLQRNAETFDIPKEGYMLEENEVFVYADKGVTEYITLGPGTVLRPKGDSIDKITLVNTPFTTLQGALTSNFNAVPAPILAQAYELTSVLAPGVFAVPETESLTSNWTNVDKDDILLFYGEKNGKNISVVGDIADGSLITGDITKTMSGEYRLAFMFQSDAAGSALISPDTTLKLGWGEKQANDTYSNSQTFGGGSEGAGTDTLKYLTSSVPFTGVFAGAGSLFLPNGISAKFSTSTANVDLGVNRDYIESSYQMTADKVSFRFKDTNNFSSVSTSLVLAELSLSQPAANNEIYAILFNISFTPKQGQKLTGKIKLAVSNIVEGNTSYISLAADTSTNVGTIELDLSDDKYKYGCTLLIRPGSKSTKLTVHFAESNSSALCGTAVEMTSLSFITGYADEIASQSYKPEFSLNDALYKKVASLLPTDTKRFNYLCTPSEKYAYPAEAASYFNPAHPLNSKVLPYIKYIPSKIVIVKER